MKICLFAIQLSGRHNTEHPQFSDIWLLGRMGAEFSTLKYFPPSFFLHEIIEESRKSDYVQGYNANEIIGEKKKYTICVELVRPHTET